MSEPELHSGRRAAFELLLISLLALFAELMVIRWLASEIRVFAYFKNLPLLAGFLGLGLGCARPQAHRLARLFPFLFGGLCLLIAFAGPLRLVHLKFPDTSIALWKMDQVTGIGTSALSLCAVLAIFAWTTAAFAALGVRLGGLFDRFAPLRAYSLNVAGSLAGVAAFSAVSLTGWPPLAWLAITAAVAIWLDRRLVAALAWAITLGCVALAPQASAWSPYYRIDLASLMFRGDRGPVQVGTRLEVNHDYHQRILDLSAGFLAAHPEIAAHEAMQAAVTAYELPFRVAPSHDSVLVVGAGTGNDVAAALRHGARSVDAVEIDPTILEIGRERHPEGPYASPSVRTIVADARAFLRQTDRVYDLIVYGLLDSHTMFSSMSSLRLDNYVYTVESFREATRRLDDDGILAVAFSAQPGDWIGQRIMETLRQGTGTEPLAFETGYDVGVTFFAGPGLARLRAPAAAAWTPKDPGVDHVRVATDDWPFLYVRPGARPTAYVLVLGAILLGAWAAVRSAFRSRLGEGRFDAHLFLMGAAFMLVEVKSVAQLSLLAGSTWLVNAAVFAGVLAMILAANALVAALKPERLAPWYAGLGLALLLPFAAPLAQLNALSFPARVALGSAIVSLPILFAGVVFAGAFRRVAHPSSALASNLFGAVVGGILEYASVLTGIGSLGVLALLLYAASYVVLLLRRRAPIGSRPGDLRRAAVDDVLEVP